MRICILLVLSAITICVVGDAQLQPIKSQDLKTIVHSVKEDVDRHLKQAYSFRRMKSTFPDLPLSLEGTENEKEYANFMAMIQDSIHHHLVRNLGQPSDAENEGTSTLFNIESTSEQLSKDAEDDRSEKSKVDEIRVGSTKGVPGINFPDYTDIPITSFTCPDKHHLPQFYADLDTGCQVFHVCWPDRRESFLCPMGTIFNQALKVCDYWHSFNCSLAPYYYIMNPDLKPDLSKDESESSTIHTLFEKTDSSATWKPDSSTYGYVKSDSVVPFVSQFIPIKAKIVVYPKTATQRLKIVTTATVGESKKSDFKHKSRRNDPYTSKHSRVPRSLEYTKSIQDAAIDELPLPRTAFLYLEALDRAIIDIESNETLSKLSGYARRAAKSIKSIFSYMNIEPLEDFSPEPGSYLYELDMVMKEIMKEEVWKNMLLIVARLMEIYHEREAKFLRELKAQEPEPLTNLNPRFVIKPEENSRLEDSELPTLVERVKRSTTISNPSELSDEDSLNIHPETIEFVLKHYINLFKTKHKNA